MPANAEVTPVCAFIVNVAWIWGQTIGAFLKCQAVVIVDRKAKGRRNSIMKTKVLRKIIMVILRDGIYTPPKSGAKFVGEGHPGMRWMSCAI